MIARFWFFSHLLFCPVAYAVDPPASSHMQKIQVLIQTTMGQFVVALDAQNAPITVKNFLNYVRNDFYNGTIFHRVIPGFVVQGGGYTSDMQLKKTQKPIVLESQNGLKNQRGSIAMARTSDPNSASSQVFINLVDNEVLDRPKPDGYGYAVFGQVVQGMEVVDRIAAVKRNGEQPVEDIVIIRTTIL